MNLHHGDCLDVMAGMEPESVDAVVTDPPYSLSFMSKSWDTGFGHSRWAEAAYRVAKPSAYLLAFGGTRTVHRMTVALEDAGWIIRDMLVWAYACLSDDTEILTEEGWVRYNSPNVGQLAAAFDPDSGELRWERIEAVHRYRHEGDMAEVGPSLVTLNHRVVLDETTARVPCLPDMWHDVYSPVGVGQEGERVVLLPTMQRRRTATGSPVHAGSGVVTGTTATLVRADDGTTQSGLEGRSYRVQEARELLGSPLRALAGVGATDGPEGRLHHGASAGDSRGVRVPIDQDGVREPREPRSDRQRPGEPDALAGQPDAQALRMGQVSGGNGYPDPVRLVDYAGVVWCITVPSGAFVARRNGVVFVTGNSGFPKSKASLKPAWEPIVMARKPGPLRMLAIDACRIGVAEGQGGGARASDAPVNGFGVGGYRKGDGFVASEVGRWPANVILTDPIFDGGVEGVVGGGETTSGSRNGTYSRGGYRGDWPDVSAPIDGDTGTYSRFFLVPKSSRSDREPVLAGGDREGELTGLDERLRTKTERANVHPTVKPVDLMRHLVRLVTPTGGTVLDPFLGSGTTALAAEMEGFQWVGIEREEEYVAIAEARLNGVQRGLGLDVPAPTPTWKDYPTATRYPVKGPSKSSWFTESTRDDPDHEETA